MPPIEDALLEAERELEAEVQRQFEQASPTAPAATTETTEPSTQDGEDDFSSFYVNTPEAAASEPAPEAEPEPVAPVSPTANVAMTADDLIRLAKEMARERVAEHVPTAPVKEAEKPLYEASEIELDETEKEQWATHEKTISKLVKKALAQYHETIKPTLQNTQDELRRTQAEATLGVERAFQSQVEAAIPNLNSITQDKRWKDYLSKAAPHSGGSWSNGDILANHLRERNINGVLEIVKSFAPPVAPTATAVAPSKGSAAVPSRTPAGKQMLAYSKLSNAADRATSDSTYAASAEWAKVQRLYEQAAVDGNIDYNA